MPLHVRPSQRLSLLLLHFLWVGCASQPQAPEQLSGALFIGDSTSAVYPGALDAKNRYLSNVAIHTGAKREDGSEHCSGVLISPQELLTAGHCVCMKRKLSTPDARAELDRRLREALPSSGRSAAERASIDAQRKRILANTATLIDSSLCAPNVRVEVVEYLPSPPDTPPSLRLGRYSGKVIHPHPKLLVLDDAMGTSWFREADLALIHLATPVRERFRPIALPDKEVQVGSPIVMVGLGFGEDNGTTTEFGDRHYGESVIETVERLAPDSIKFLARAPPQGATPAPRVYGGDSGGGCFSKTGNRVLVGVISAFGNDGTSSIFTSVFAYREWLNKELSHSGAVPIAP
ncbi:trypsin-like serine protease [Hyalangium minutum]|uniref:Peptidase S1 domain-containing protein n=1 Tax=Hyalangium minutum TaxID=394096 RepID=A0A085W655_9BACT|nr:trypsin-like serine protease [Hyalangium minutum]KFE63168.1 hypothetical protein DB31_2761 [Hyalangium minutum]